MKRKLLLMAMLVTSFSCIAAEHAPHWGYDGQDGPENWSKISPDFSLCSTGKNQSPINIHDSLKTHHSNLQLTTQPSKQEMVNNGHTIQVNVTNGSTLVLDEDTFTLQQFHFHSPSENLIDGKQFPLEAHFVFKDKDGALAVLALMFKEGKPNQQLTEAWQKMPTEAGQSIALSKPIDIKTLSDKQQKFYRFSASLTTPQCSEGVRWIVFKEPVNISAEQVSQFSSAMKHHANNRPVQPLNGRVIIN
ncbi:TPA: carbonic anhydrase [Yersinia enterocolitica]